MDDRLVRRLSKLHKVIYKATGGLIGRRLVSNDMLLLTTTGRRTGKPHTVPLLYLEEGGRLVVIASYGGRPNHPSWYLNLLADPDVTVQTPDDRFDATASTAGVDERAAWWPKIVDAYRGYSAYQDKTNREIPVVFLDPR
jgi:F420H(2)-dependent quinone reductase